MLPLLDLVAELLQFFRHLQGDFGTADGQHLVDDAIADDPRLPEIQEKMRGMLNEQRAILDLPPLDQNYRVDGDAGDDGSETGGEA